MCCLADLLYRCVSMYAALFPSFLCKGAFIACLFSSRCASRGLCEVLAILQYPLTGRTSCNLKVYPPAYFTLPLAVPSHGSNLIQQRAQPRSQSASRPCSTLSRVEPHATVTGIILAAGT